MCMKTDTCISHNKIRNIWYNLIKKLETHLVINVESFEVGFSTAFDFPRHCPVTQCSL